MITIDKEYERKFKELELYRQIRNEKGYNIEWFIKNDDKLLQNADSFNINTNKSSSNINTNTNTNTNTNNSTSTTEEGISGPILDFVVGKYKVQSASAKCKYKVQVQSTKYSSVYKVK
jgi:hypothetical protein